jgi:ankyrin repeat protein
LAVDDNGDTILHTVASKGSVEMLNLLITKYKCPVNSKNNGDETPLHYACKEGNVAAVRVLSYIST